MHFTTASVVFIVLLISSYPCGAQQMVQVPTDAKILEQREKEFVGKPLRILFKEIQPEIKLVLARPGDIERASVFVFFFNSKKEYDSYRAQQKTPLSIRVYIQGHFKWDYTNKTIQNYLNWTKEDEEKYGSLIVGAIRVFCGDELCEVLPQKSF